MLNACAMTERFYRAMIKIRGTHSHRNAVFVIALGASANARQKKHPLAGEVAGEEAVDTAARLGAPCPIKADVGIILRQTSDGMAISK